VGSPAASIAPATWTEVVGWQRSGLPGMATRKRSRKCYSSKDHPHPLVLIYDLGRLTFTHDISQHVADERIPLI
jgi:hypothetical protein